MCWTPWGGEGRGRMTADEALKQAQRLFLAGHYIISDHARRQMLARDVSPRDLRNAIVNANTCRPGHSGRWLIEGVDRDGDSLTVVVEIRANLMIVTVRE